MGSSKKQSAGDENEGNATQLWTLAKEGDTVAAWVRRLEGGAFELVTTLNGSVFYARLFTDQRRFLKAAKSIRSMMHDQGWRAAEPNHQPRVQEDLDPSESEFVRALVASA